MYKPEIARWLSIDPKGWKYPGIAPYVYVNNMPIWAIDPTGETIWVKASVHGTCSPDQKGDCDVQNIKNNNYNNYYKYEAGQLLELNNKTNVWEPSLTEDRYALDVRDHLNTLKSQGGEECSDVISRLEARPDINIIVRYPTSPDKKNRFNDINGVGVLEYDPNNEEKAGSIIRMPEVGLSHEIGHARDQYLLSPNDPNHLDNARKINVESANGEGVIPKSEINGINFENPVRFNLGQPKRIFFNKKQIPESELRDTHGSDPETEPATDGEH